jgi:hypothetical protein
VLFEIDSSVVLPNIPSVRFAANFHIQRVSQSSFWATKPWSWIVFVLLCVCLVASVVVVVIVVVAAGRNNLNTAGRRDMGLHALAAAAAAAAVILGQQQAGKI